MNRRLHNGEFQDVILAWLNNLTLVKDILAEHFDGVPISPKNLSEWRAGGHQDYLADLRWQAYKDKKIESALKTLMQDEKSDVRDQSLVVIASLLYDLIAEFNLDGVKESLSGNPDAYAKIVNCFTRLSQSALARQKFRHAIAEQKSKQAAAFQPGQSKGGIRPETLEKIKRELNL